MITRLSQSRLALTGLFVLAAFIGAAILFAMQNWLPGGGGSDRAQIEKVVHQYVLDHPELIPEAMRRLQDRETGQVIAANQEAILTPVASAWMGNPKGDVTIVEYFDYNCGFCRASLPTIAALVKADPNVKIVFRELPVLSEESGVAARWSLAAARAGKFNAFHEALYAAGPISDASLAAATRTAGLDPAALREAAHAPGIDDAIRTNMAMAQQLGITGTPAWVIGDRVMSGAMTLDQMKDAVAEARKQG
ncbi:DsbA family protein [Hephaestia sp. GCM10023244]|uniref:DsbA family protein n=1 Tax=unclassified Hephaestia TaxID=2631281 RepID=UPI0020773138|nr:DsbA family protein [Hephaestia sp. MAHUQ-44]MCM8729412.1 DsbA family protein [Hephaestia sp. MAHUQ-44]